MPERRAALSESHLHQLHAARTRLLAPFLRLRGGTHALVLENAGWRADGDSLPPPAPGYCISLALQGEQWQGGVRAMACELPFGDESFALLLAADVFEALPDPGGLAGELARVSQSGARFLLCGLVHWHPQSLRLARHARRGDAYCRLRPMRALTRLLDLYGFERECVQRIGCSYLLVLRKRRASARILYLQRARTVRFSGRVPVWPGDTRGTRA